MGHHLLSQLLDPTPLCLLVLFAGLMCWSFGRSRRIVMAAKVLSWSALIGFLLVSSPWFSNLLMRSVQPDPVDLSLALSGSQEEHRALVVLGGGNRNEYDHVPPIERLDGATQGRLIGAARVYREHGFGVVVVTGSGEAYVQAMADLLVLLGVPAQKLRLDPRAFNTITNAQNALALLRPYSIHQVVLVTSAVHMPRSVQAFEQAGLAVIPAPVDYHGATGWRLIPSSSKFAPTSQVLHELLGRLKRDP